MLLRAVEATAESGAISMPLGKLCAAPIAVALLTSTCEMSLHYKGLLEENNVRRPTEIRCNRAEINRIISDPSPPLRSIP